MRLIAMGLILMSCAANAVRADDAATTRQFRDALLDQFVGDWHVTRTFRGGRTAQNTVHAEWVLNHQWLKLEYRDVATPPRYEATVFIGYDDSKKQYVCHWMDNFGGSFSLLGWGKLDEPAHALEFTFSDPAGGAGGSLTNRFTFDPKARTWTSAIRQIEQGEWKLFCEDKFTLAEEKK